MHDLVKVLASASDIDEGLGYFLLDEIIGNDVVKENIGEAAEVFNFHIYFELKAFEYIF